MRVVLIRHGETVENREGICQGQSEGRLSELGVLQAWLTAGELKNTNIDICISSDLKRAIETAEIILTGRDIYIDKEPSLRERNYGKLQGRHFSDFSITPDLMENMESEEELKNRVSFIVRLLKRSPLSSNVLIVSHGITLRILILSLIENSEKCDLVNSEKIDNCSITILERDDSGHFTIKEFNNTNHLKTNCL